MSAQSVGDILEGYANRGVIRGFSRQQTRGGNGHYRLLWHRGQVFDLKYDHRKQTLRLACVLPAVPGESDMYRAFKGWLKQRQGDKLPDHRRCDRSKVSLRPYNRGGNIALTLGILDGDVEYAASKLMSLVNEIYLDFLSNGLYFDWLVETFDLDPDKPY